MRDGVTNKRIPRDALAAGLLIAVLVILSCTVLPMPWWVILIPILVPCGAFALVGLVVTLAALGGALAEWVETVRWRMRYRIGVRA